MPAARGGPVRRALALLAALLLALAGGAGRASAAPPPEKPFPVRLRVVPALGLKSAPAGFIPVLVTAAYVDPEAWEGGERAGSAPERFVFRLAALRWGMGPARATAVREESLAPGTAKRFFLTVSCPSDCMLVVTAHRARDDAKAAAPVPLDGFEIESAAGWNPYNPRYGSSTQPRKVPYRIAVLSGPRTTALNWLPSMDLPNRMEAMVARVEDPSEVPDRRVGWAPFDLVVLHDWSIQSLSPEQQEALRSYVLGGGHLLVSAGTDPSWLAQPFFRDLLPPGRPRAAPRTTYDGEAVPEHQHVFLEGAPRGIDGAGPGAVSGGRVPQLTDLVPDEAVRRTLASAKIQEIGSALSEAEALFQHAESMAEWEGTDPSLVDDGALVLSAHEAIARAQRLAAEAVAEALTRTAAPSSATGGATRIASARGAPSGAAAAPSRRTSPVPRWPAGRGDVALLPFDLSGPLLKDAGDALRARVWTRILEPYRTRDALGSDTYLWPVAAPPETDWTTLATLLPDYALPILAISALAVLYVLVVGPLNFFVLRRLGREPWVVFSVPAIAVACVAATVAAGYIVQGTTARLYEATMFRAYEGDRWALESRHLAVLSATPSVVEVPLAPEEDGAAVAGRRDEAFARGYTVVEGSPRRIGGLALARWQGAMVRADSVRDLGGGVRVTVEDDGAYIHFHVVNETSRRLERVYARHVRVAGRYEGGPIPPGGEATLGFFPPPSGAQVYRPPPRATLEDRLANAALEHLVTLRRGWKLAATLAPDAPRPPAEGVGAWGGNPAPLERGALLVVQPREDAP